MASTSLLSASFLVLFVFLFSSSSLCNAATATLPSAIVVPVTRDPNTLDYITEIHQRTPLQKQRLVLDITGDFLLVKCGDGSYKSSTYRPEPCGSTFCREEAESTGCITKCYGTREPGCNNNTCAVGTEHTLARNATRGALGRDVLLLSSTDGTNPGPKVTVPRFAFSCTAGSTSKGRLGQGVVGMLGLNRARLALTNQVSRAFNIIPKFALCLPGGRGPGAIFFGAEPYVFLPGIDISQGLAKTALSSNPKFPNQYFISVNAIQVGDKNINIDSAKLEFNSQGKGGTKLSTLVPYTTVATPVYAAIRDAFVKEAQARNISRVPAVKPFDACFDAKTVLSTRVGPAVPTIGLVFTYRFSNTVWKIMGGNSMVQVSDKVLCLGFVDGGEDPTTTIVIGGHQMQDNLLQFDLSRSEFGFSSTLLGRQTTCSNFNFTSTA